MMNMEVKNIAAPFSILVILILFSGVFTNSHAQNLSNMENELFGKLLNYQFNKNEIDSLNIELKITRNNLEKLKANEAENKEKIIAVMSSSVIVTNRLRDLNKNQKKADEEINTLRNRMYSFYEAKIDSLRSAESESNRIFVQQDILNYTEKKLLVQPKLGVLSIDPLKLLNLRSNRETPLTRKIVREYFTEAISEVDSHLTVINQSLEEVEEIIQLSSLTESFLEETNLESETRSMNLFTFSEEAKNLTDGNSYEGGDRETPEAIKNSTLLGANTFATILEQLSVYSNEIQKNKYENKLYNESDISLEEYSALLLETKKRLNGYKLSLTKKVEWLNE